jgi:hypothetical protein
VKIGASYFPALLGFDPFVSPYAAGAQLLGITTTEQSEAMRNGLFLERAHAEMIEADGFTLMPAPAAGFVHPEHEWLVGHPDYLIALDDTWRAPLELKLRGVAPSDQLKTRDTLQTFVYMNILRVPVGMVSWLHGGYGGVVREHERVKADPELWEMMLERVSVIRDGLMNRRLPAPDGTESTRDALRDRFAEATNGTVVRLSRAEWAHVRKIRELDEVIATAKKQRERHAQIVQEAMGDATEAVSPMDTPAARWRTVSSARLATKELRAAHPDIAGEFTKTTTTRSFSVNV